MNNLFRKMLFTSIKRRRKEIRRVSTIAFLSAFFMFATLLLQDNFDAYQQRSNRLNYGNWYLSEATKGTEPDTYLTQNAYFDKYGTMVNGPAINNTKYYMGYADDTMLEIGNIRLRSGHMPENDNEIVMQINLMALLGLKSEVGQTVNLTYLNGSGVPVNKDYVISGILVNITDNWINGDDLPAALVTKQCFDEINVVKSKTYMYHLRDFVNIKNDSKFVDELDNSVKDELTFNKFAFEKGVWGDLNAYWEIIIVLVFMSLSALVYTYYSYVSKRKSEYYRFRCFGVSRWELKTIIIYEGLYSCIPAAILGLILALALSLILALVLKLFYQTEFIFAIKPISILIGLISIAATIILSIFTVTLFAGDKRIYINTFKIPIKKLNRINPINLNHRNISKTFYSREWRIYPLKKIIMMVLSISVSIFILMCLNKLSEDYHRGYGYYVNGSDFTAGIKSQSFNYPYNENEEHPARGAKELNSYFNSFSNDFYDSLNSIPGIKSIDYYTVDNSKVITWDGIEDSPIRAKQFAQLSQFKSIKDENKEYAYAYASVFYPDAKSVYEKYKSDIPEKYYDPEAFARGEQVIYLFPSLTGTGIGSKENSLSIGDKITYKTESGDIQATVVAKLYKDIGPFIHMNSRYEYDFLASTSLGEKIATADNQKFGFNRLRLVISPYVSFSGTNKRISNLLSENKLDFDDNYEEKTLARNAFLQKIFVFSMLIIVVFSIYVVIYINMISSTLNYKRYNLQLFRNLGTTKNKLFRLEIRKSIWDNLWILLSLPILYGIDYYNSYKRISIHWRPIVENFSGEMVKRTKFESATRFMKLYLLPLPVTIAIIILIIIIMLLITIIPIIHYIKNMKKEN